MHVVVIMAYDEMKKKRGRTLKFLRECREVSDKKKKKKKTKVVAINGKGY